MARDGGLVDIHVTGFVSSIDSLLTAGRSNAPTRVLQPMKGVVNAVTAIIEDVRAFERRPQRERAEVDLEALQALRERLEATLSNLVTAAKTHATSAGMAPVSLLDAAASHVSATVTEIGKTVHIRKATKAEQDAFMPAGASNGATNGFTPSLRAVDELRSATTHQRSGSSTSSRGGDDMRYGSSPTTSPRVTPRRPPSNMSSSNASSPPPLFEKSKMNGGGNKSDSSVTGEGPEDAWAELKVRPCPFTDIAELATYTDTATTAIPGSTDGVHRVRDSKRAVWSTEPDAVPDTEREPDADHHDRVQHRRCVQRQPAAGVKGAGRGDLARARGACEQAKRGAGTGGHHQGEQAGDGEEQLCGRECDEGAHEAVVSCVSLSYGGWVLVVFGAGRTRLWLPSLVACGRSSVANACIRFIRVHVHVHTIIPVGRVEGLGIRIGNTLNG